MAMATVEHTDLSKTDLSELVGNIQPQCCEGEDHPAQWFMRLTCCGAGDTFCSLHKSRVIEHYTSILITSVNCAHCGTKFPHLKDAVRWEKL